MKLLFLNSLKGLKKKKIQMIGIVLLVMLSTGIYVAMQSSLDRMEEKYYSYLEEQHVEHLTIDYNIDYKTDLTLTDLNYIKEHFLTNLNKDEKEIIAAYESYLKGKINPFDNISFEYVLSSVISKNGAREYIVSRNLEPLSQKYDFEYELELSKALKSEDTYLKVIPYNEDKNINKAYLIEGELPVNDKEITILPKYAKIHNIKIGDDYKIGDNTYKVVGFTYAPDYIYPLVSYSSIMFDEETNNVVYINKENYEEITGVEEKTYSIFYHGDIKRKFEITDLDVKNVDDSNVLKIFKEENPKLMMGIFAATRLGRIAALQLEFATNRLFAEYFLYLLLGIAVFVIAIITKKRIEDERLQIGVLKSLGYSPITIAVSYLVYPIIGSLIGGILGYTIGSLVNGPIASMYISFYLIPLAGFKINPKYISNCLILPTVLLSVLSYIIALIMLRKKPLALLKEGSNLKVNIFSKIANKLTSLLPFNYRFKYSLAFRSLPKLIIVAITSFFTGMLIVLTLIGFNLMDNAIEQSFAGMDYKYMIYMNQIETEKLDDEPDYIIDASIPLVKITSSKGDVTFERKEDENVIVSLTGLDQDSKYVDILDSNDKSIKNKLKEDEIVVSKNLVEQYKINIGDTIEFALDDEYKNTINLKVAGISNEFMSLSGYVDREYICKYIGFKDRCYSSMLSNDTRYSKLELLDKTASSKIATILNFSDMKDNIKKTIEKYNVSIYIVIAFASIMAFVIIAVIANIVVEENKKIISLMKVMGYKNNKISSIVLNIYTPVIIISYFLSIPVTKKLLAKIIKALAGDMQVTIPIELSFAHAMLGFAGLLVAYYIAVALSKRVLNKIPLAIALKRE